MPPRFGKQVWICMYCRHCGKELPEGAEICPSCGRPVSGEDAAAENPAEAPDPDKVLTEEEKEEILRKVREERAEAERKAAEQRQAEEKRRQQEEDAKHQTEAARRADEERRARAREVFAEDDSDTEFEEAGGNLSPEEREKILRQAREELAENERLKAEKRQAEEREKEEARRAKEKIDQKIEFETEQRIAESKRAAEERRRAQEQGQSPENDSPFSGSGQGTDSPSDGSPNGPGAGSHAGYNENRWTTAGPGERGPYSRTAYTGDVRQNEDSRSQEGDKFANASIGCSIAAIFLTVFPYAGIPLGLMGLIFGILALHDRTVRNGRAVCGIVIGIGTVLLGTVLIIAMSALMPYEEQLLQMFQEYINSVS